jgi:hypothetical protein
MSAAYSDFWLTQLPTPKPIDWKDLLRAVHNGARVACHVRRTCEAARPGAWERENASALSFVFGLAAFFGWNAEQSMKEAAAHTGAAGRAAPGAEKRAPDDGATAGAKKHAEGSGAAPADPICAAADLLDVSIEASADEIRAALRKKMVASRLHPDQGGDEETAKRYIAAQNLLVERAKMKRAGEVRS